mmetsp:Transcript_15506/g.34235  ORF Transcript_15506/g.34235 Transcript_15506/m.34235 type:complete len:249 (+) Transcript_15506:208-954(+)
MRRAFSLTRLAALTTALSASASSRGTGRVGDITMQVPPLPSMAARAEEVNPCARTVRPETLSSSPPTTLAILRPLLALVTRPASKRDAKSTSELASASFSTSSLISSYSVRVCPFCGFLNLGRRRYRGVCPPSKPGLTPPPLPDLLFWPRIPRPQEPPWPAAIPLPTRRKGLRDPGMGKIVLTERTKSSGTTQFSKSCLFFQSKIFMLRVEPLVATVLPVTPKAWTISKPRASTRNAIISLVIDMVPC